MAVTSKIQFRRPAEAFGSPGRRPVLAGGNARPPGCPHRGAGPTQVGPGPIRQITTSPKTIKHEEICTNSFFACRVMPKWCWATLLDAQMLLEVLLKAQKQSWDHGSDGVTWESMQDETQAFPYRKCLLNLFTRNICGQEQLKRRTRARNFF